MKILRLILIISAVALISSKTETNKNNISAEKNLKAKQNYSENPIAGVAVPNDHYLLQQVEVRNFFKQIFIKFDIINQKKIRDSENQ